MNSGKEMKYLKDIFKELVLCKNISYLTIIDKSFEYYKYSNIYILF